MDISVKITPENPSVSIENKREAEGILYFDVHITLKETAVPEPVRLGFGIPSIDVYSTWSPQARFDHSLCPNWLKKKTESRLASWMPLHTLVSLGGNNRMTVALSDAKTPITVATGVSEETGEIECDLTFFTVKVAPLSEYRATVRIDRRDIPFYDSVRDAVSWWENDCGYVPAYVPEHARLPMNSIWYSYHQEIDVESILRECALSKPLGMETVIIDDGWQTDDNNRGYAFCGDWEVTPHKIPDMKDFVDRVHALGMKIMLWYSVPYMGVNAKLFDRFRGMLLAETGNKRTYFALDPRYKEVRDYLISVYARAVSEWGLDGLKLDFIDSFFLRGESLLPDEKRDYPSLEDAIDVLMTDVMNALRAINPEILIEFRQSYVGPSIRRFGNMLRVADCPNDSIRNRQDVVHLRLTSGKTPVHSDMLMWHKDDTVESAALQVISTLYSVPQISMRLEGLREDHKRMLAFYLDFWRKERDMLLDGTIRAEHPEAAYSKVTAEKDGRAVVTLYSDPTVSLGDYGEMSVVNASGGDTVILLGASGCRYTVYSCMGDVLSEGSVTGDVSRISVPVSALLKVTRA